LARVRVRQNPVIYLKIRQWSAPARGPPAVDASRGSGIVSGPKPERIPIGMTRDALWILSFAHILAGKPMATFPGYALGWSSSKGLR
jgi:hypothetical protein